MSHSVLITRRARNEPEALAPDAYRRVRPAILALAEAPRPAGCAKLADREGWRIRVGDLRVLYTIDDRARQVVIVHVGHRRDVYRR
jgi:mRNA interferase RelE/StbE